MEELFNIAVFEAAIFAVHAVIIGLTVDFIIGSIGRAYRRSLICKAKAARAVGSITPEWPSV